MYVTNANESEFFNELILTDLLFFMCMRKNFIIEFSLLFLVRQQNVGVIFKRDKLILVELFFLDIVETDEIFPFVIIHNGASVIFVWIFHCTFKVFNICGTTCQVIENMAHLQFMKRQVSSMDFSISFLQ